MKKKVNINREKVSSGEIQSRRNFSSLIKNYTQVGNPFRRTSWRTKGLLWVIIASAVLVYIVNTEQGCEHEIYKEYNTKFPSQKWEKNTTLIFTPVIDDTTSSYKIKLLLRHVYDSYFKEIPVSVKAVSPSGWSVSKTYTIQVAKEVTEKIEECTGDICELEMVIEAGMHFRETGQYSFQLEHRMPMDTLSAIIEVGLAVEKNP